MGYLDDLAAQAHLTAVQSVEQELVANHQGYQKSLIDEDANSAAYYLQELAGAQQKLAMLRPAQRGDGLTERERHWLAQRPTLTADANKLRQVHEVATRLLDAGVQRDSPEYFSGLELRLSAVPGIGGEEALTPTEAARISGVHPTDYNRGVDRLEYLKSLGEYKSR
jgi:hypothetical protein